MDIDELQGLSRGAEICGGRLGDCWLKYGQAFERIGHSYCPDGKTLLRFMHMKANLRSCCGNELSQITVRGNMKLLKVGVDWLCKEYSNKPGI
jgi:hypothetical protein